MRARREIEREGPGESGQARDVIMRYTRKERKTGERGKTCRVMIHSCHKKAWKWGGGGRNEEKVGAREEQVEVMEVSVSMIVGEAERERVMSSGRAKKEKKTRGEVQRRGKVKKIFIIDDASPRSRGKKENDQSPSRQREVSTYKPQNTYVCGRRDVKEERRGEERRRRRDTT